MPKAVKWIAISLLSLIVVVLLAMAVVPLLLPLESMVAEALEKKTGRPVKVESVSLSLLGGAELEVKGLEVEELQQFGDRPLIKLKRLYAQVSLLPLLDGTVILNKVEVDGLELSVVSSKQGKLNIETLAAYAKPETERHQPVEPPKTPDMETAETAKPHVFVSQFDMTGSVVHLQNLATGKSAQWPVTQATMLTKIHGDAADIHIKLQAPGLNFLARTTQGASGEPTRILAKMDLAEFGKRAAVVLPGLQCQGKTKLSVQVRGTSANPEVSAEWTMDNLYVHLPQSGIAPLELQNAIVELAVTGDTKARTVNLHNFRVWLPSAGYELKANCVMSPDKSRGELVQEANLAMMGRAFAAFLPKGLKLSGWSESKVDLDGDAESITLHGRNVIKDMVVHVPGAPKPFTDKHVELFYDLKLDGKGNVAIDEIAVMLDAVKFTAKGTASLGKIVKSKLQVRGTLLDLDSLMLLVPGSTGTEKQIKPGRKEPVMAAGSQRDSGKKTTPDQDEAAMASDLRRALNKVDITLDLDIIDILYSGLEMKGLRATVKFGQGKAALENLYCKMFDGWLRATAALDAKPAEPSSELTVDIDKMTITPERFRQLQKATHIFSLPMRIVKGVFNVKAHVKARGLAPEHIKRTAEGKGEIKVLDGVEVAFDALDRMQGSAIFAPLVRENIPEFYSSMDGNYTMADGKLHYNLNFLESREKVDVRIKGVTMLSDGRVDAKMMLSGEGIGRDLRRFLEPDGTIPIEIKGTFEQPVAVLRITGSLIQNIFGK